MTDKKKAGWCKADEYQKHFRFSWTTAAPPIETAETCDSYNNNKDLEAENAELLEAVDGLIRERDDYWVVELDKANKMNAKLRDAADALCTYYEKALDVGPGKCPTREALLWRVLRIAIGRKENKDNG